MSGRGRCGGSAFDGAPPLAQAHSRSRRGQHACAAGSGSQRGSARHLPPRTVDCPCLRRLPPAPHPPQPGPPPGASQEVLRRGGASLPCEVEDLLPRGWRGGLSGRAKGLQEKEPKAASLGGPFGYSQGLLRTNNCLPSKRSSFQRLICAEVATKVPGVFLTTVALRAGECEAARLWQPRGKDMEEASLPWPAERLNAPGISRRISVSEFSCHCCYDILINPTTLNCGHSFCRHCLALWWMSSKRNECPECREKWEGFPKVNILLRNAVEKLFPVAIEQRKDDILQNHEATQSLAAFQKYGSDQPTAALNAGRVNPPGGGFFSGVLTALTCVAVVLLGYHWSSRESEDGLLVHKPVAKWTTEEVAHWLGQLGPWTSLYRERFLQERVNGRLLLTLTDEELRQAPYQVENSSHRKAIAMELERVKLLGVKPPQNLWEYKAVQPGRSLFLLYALKSSPRLTMLYLYLSDYSDTFLPFIHTVCPVSEAQELEDVIAKLHDHKDPVWKQWREFLVKFAFLPYQLLAEFAWDWLETHYWTSRFIIVNAMLLSVLELFSFWRLWSRRELKRIPYRMWSHFWKMSTQGFLMAIFWPVIPQFACNCLFYWALYFNPIINIDLVVKEVRRLETQVL